MEQGGRVFPASDRASDVLAALEKFLTHSRVQIKTGTVAAVLVEEGRVCGVKLDHGETLAANSVIIATGGCSYP